MVAISAPLAPAPARGGAVAAKAGHTAKPARERVLTPGLSVTKRYRVRPPPPTRILPSAVCLTLTVALAGRPFLELPPAAETSTTTPMMATIRPMDRARAFFIFWLQS